MTLTIKVGSPRADNDIKLLCSGGVHPRLCRGGGLPRQQNCLAMTIREMSGTSPDPTGKRNPKHKIRNAKQYRSSKSQ